MLRSSGVALLLSFILCCARAAGAQSIIDPGAVEFTASADHNALDPVGQPLVVRYDFLLYIVGSGLPAQVVDIGKPSPDGNSTIRIALTTILDPLPTPGVAYEIRIAAVGPAGASPSTPSNSFAFQTGCSPTISSSGQSFPASGGSAGVNVTVGAGCAWSAASNASWMTVTSGSGIGSGTATFAVNANTGTSPRTGTMTVAGLPFTVTQAATSTCSYAVAPGSQSVAAVGGAATFTVASPPGCGWSVSEQSSWISITSGATGAGNGTVTFAIAPNTGTQTRSAEVTMAGRWVTLVQGALTPPNAPTGFRIVK